MSRITICIPVFNMARTIARTVTSALAQRYDDFDVLLVDNGSTDGTWEYATSVSDTRFRAVRNTTNLGAYGNHNRCVALATGEWIKFLHGDDELLPDCLTSFDAAAQVGPPGMALIGGGAICLDENDAEINRTFVPARDFRFRAASVLEFCMAGNIFGTPSMIMAHRASLIQAGQFDLSIEPAADNDCWINLRRLFPSVIMAAYCVKIRNDPRPPIRRRASYLARESARVAREVVKWWRLDPTVGTLPLSKTGYADWLEIELIRFWRPAILYASAGHFGILRGLWKIRKDAGLSIFPIGRLVRHPSDYFCGRPNRRPPWPERLARLEITV